MKKVSKVDLYSIRIGELAEILEPFELRVLLSQESNSSKTDILLDNMLDYYVSVEKYDYAIVLRDEINSRK